MPPPRPAHDQLLGRGGRCTTLTTWASSSACTSATMPARARAHPGRQEGLRQAAAQQRARVVRRLRQVQSQVRHRAPRRGPARFHRRGACPCLLLSYPCRRAGHQICYCPASRFESIWLRTKHKNTDDKVVTGTGRVCCPYFPERPSAVKRRAPAEVGCAEAVGAARARRFWSRRTWETSRWRSPLPWRCPSGVSRTPTSTTRTARCGCRSSGSSEEVMNVRAVFGGTK